MKSQVKQNPSMKAISKEIALRNKEKRNEFNEKMKRESEDLQIMKSLVEKKARQKILLSKEIGEKNPNNKINLDNPIVDIAEKVKSAVATNEKYIMRRYQSANIHAKIQGQKIRRLLDKVDNYLKYSSLGENSESKENAEPNYEAIAEKELNDEEQKKKASSDKIKKITDRLYQHKEKDKEIIEENKKLVETNKKRPKSVFKPGGSTEVVITENKTKVALGKLLKLPVIAEKIILTQEVLNDNQQNSRVTSFVDPKRLKLEKEIEESKAAENELKTLIKDYGYDMKMLLAYKKQYKHVDISSYIHKAHLSNIKKKKKGRGNNADGNFIQASNQENDISEIKEDDETTNLRVQAEETAKNFDFKIEEEGAECQNSPENVEVVIPKPKKKLKGLLTKNKMSEKPWVTNFLSSCQYNQTEYIKTILMSTESDYDIAVKVNSVDYFKRKGLFYLITHNNLLMIQLNLVSGVILSDQVDVFGRNIMHYAVLNKKENADLLDILAKCVVLENKENHDELLRYATKAFPNITADYNPLEESDLPGFMEGMSGTTSKPNFEKIDSEYETKHDLKENPKVEDMLKTKTKVPVTLANNFYYGSIKKNKSTVKMLINTQDIDGKTPLHYACEKDSLEIIKILLYYGANTAITDHINDQKPIDYCSTDKCKQYIFSHEKNLVSKYKANNATVGGTNSNKATGIFKSLVSNFLPSKSTTENSNSQLQLDYIKHLTKDQVRKYSTGYEKNNYLILAVQLNDLDIFKYLLTEKADNLLYKNANGWNVLHFVLKLKRWEFMCFMFGLDKSTNSDLAQILESCSKLNFSPNDLYSKQSTSELNYLGQALLLIDSVSNNNVSPLFLSVSDPGRLEIFKSLIFLLELRMRLCEGNTVLKKESSSASIKYILNKCYDTKHEQSLIHKAVELKNIGILKYILEELSEKYEVNIYAGDKQKQNILHYSILFCKENVSTAAYIVSFEGETSQLRIAKDYQSKVPLDYDATGLFKDVTVSLWEACKNDNYKQVEEILSSSKIYNVNSQSKKFGNSPMHICIMNKSVNSALTLMNFMSEGNLIDLKLKNYKGLDCEQLVDYITDKKIKSTFKKILSKEITQLIEIQELLKAGKKGGLNTTSLSVISQKNVDEIVDKVRLQLETRKIDLIEIFKRLDENQNGKLEGYEFEALFTALKINISYDDILLLLAYADKNKDGYIDISEFSGLFRLSSK